MSVRKILSFLILMTALSGTAWSSSVSVLCYHSFWGNPKYAYDFSNQEVRAQLNYLRRNGFKFVSYSDILKGNVSGNRNILVTIDDGNITSYRAYQQVFKPYKIKPLFAIYPAIISRDRYALSWWQVREFVSDGCEIASHGYNHLFVAQRLYKKNPAAFKREIFTSKEILEKAVGQKISVFVYPFGVRSPISFKTVHEAKYQNAYSLIQRPLNLPLSHNVNQYDLPRYMFTRGNWRAMLPRIVKEAETLEAKKVNPLAPTQNSQVWQNKV